ncbi:hypothetical protein LIER_02005 [Lithospermum erythrorhizon]|uniref:Uncharacterized protein n=1 Tax=Lithospermum erythrorhizon TaxID=34254 RepID=A0AAV3NND2_LITER
MNLSNSECSSGCESGWTMYFDQHSESHQGQYNRNDEEETLRSKREHINDDYIEEQESEDLSMVSDASSGPPHLHEDEKCFVRNEYISYLSDKPEENQKKVKGLKREEKSHLDDTASSPVGAFSKEKVTFSKHFSFLKTSVKKKGASENQQVISKIRSGSNN